MRTDMNLNGAVWIVNQIEGKAENGMNMLIGVTR